jgi:glycosyltransferase involved in cell wall biosynthesis
VRNVVKELVRHKVGVLPAYETRLKFVRLPQTIALRRFERSEIARLREEFGRPEHARVSTVIPTYRRHIEVQAAIRSALAQDVDGHRVVVIDDGAGLPPELPPDPRLRAYSLSRNTGNVGVVRNVGIGVSESEVLAFLDDDNIWLPGHLSSCLTLLEQGFDLVYSGLERIDPRGVMLDILAEPFQRDEMRERSYVDASTIVARRSRSCRFSTVPRRYGDFPREDWELVWRLSRHGRVILSPSVTARYVVHNKSYFTAW